MVYKALLWTVFWISHKIVKIENKKRKVTKCLNSVKEFSRRYDFVNEKYLSIFCKNCQGCTFCSVYQFSRKGPHKNSSTQGK